MSGEILVPGWYYPFPGTNAAPPLRNSIAQYIECTFNSDATYSVQVPIEDYQTGGTPRKNGRSGYKRARKSEAEESASKLLSLTAETRSQSVMSPKRPNQSLDDYGENGLSVFTMTPAEATKMNAEPADGTDDGSGGRGGGDNDIDKDVVRKHPRSGANSTLKSQVSGSSAPASFN